MNSLGGPARLVLPVVAGLLLLAGCGEKPVVPSTRADVTAAPPSSWVAQETTDRATSTKHAKVKHKKAKTAPAAEGQWAELVDQKSGIRFSLPEDVEPITRAKAVAGGGMTQARVYQFKTDGIEVSVAVVDTETPDGTHLPVGDLAAQPPLIANGLRQAGSTDARVEGLKRLTVGGDRAVDCGIAFTAKDGQVSHWLVRSIDTDRALVMLQTIGFAEPGDQAVRDKVAALHAELVSSLHLT